jgi:hypothetical protein
LSDEEKAQRNVLTADDLYNHTPLVAVEALFRDCSVVVVSPDFDMGTEPHDGHFAKVRWAASKAFVTAAQRVLADYLTNRGVMWRPVPPERSATIGMDAAARADFVSKSCGRPVADIAETRVVQVTLFQ